jgi:hypothetical protein
LWLVILNNSSPLTLQLSVVFLVTQPSLVHVLKIWDLAWPCMRLVLLVRVDVFNACSLLGRIFKIRRGALVGLGRCWGKNVAPGRIYNFVLSDIGVLSGARARMGGLFMLLGGKLEHDFVRILSQNLWIFAYVGRSNYEAYSRSIRLFCLGSYRLHP